LKKRLQNNQQTLLDITNTAKEDVQSVDLLAVSNVELCLINYRPNNSSSRHCNLKWGAVALELHYVDYEQTMFYDFVSL
jgi:hypothetical protein